MLEHALDADAYQAVANTCGPDFAYSYLIKARQLAGKHIRPHTVVAWERLTQSRDAMGALAKAGYKLRKPERWHPGRDQPAEVARYA